MRGFVEPGFEGRFGRGDFGWWAVPRLILGLALLVLIVMACVALFRVIASPGGRFARPTPTSDAERVLRDRFARGEIDVEEFRARLDALHGRHGSSGTPGSAGPGVPGVPGL